MKTIPEQSQWLRADTKSPQIGVDREAKVIRGFVLAQEGPFKDLRGEFDVKGLKEIAKMANSKPNGLKSRFAHPSLSGDGIGSFLGRAKNVRMGVAQVERNGKLLELNAVRGDLHLDKTAFATPSGDLGSYVMDLAESDPDALSSSLVIQPDERKRLDRKGMPVLGEDGMELPPLWFPKELHAIDVVDTGDAVDGFLSAEGLSDSLVREGFAMLNGFLPGQPRNVVEARLTAWLSRALDCRFGNDPADEDEDEEVEAVMAGDLERRLRHKVRSVA